MGVVSDLAEGVILPKMIQIAQVFPNDHISEEDLPVVIHQQLSRPEIRQKICPGMSIALTCGSRGIANIALILSSIVKVVKDFGANAFIIPAMGSHGGATALGQIAVLHSLGVTENAVGCPIRSSMETDEIGKLGDGRSVCIDRFAARADGIIVVGRIKPHTAFRGPYESGLMKMMVIGMGKQYGAECCHRTGFANMAEDLQKFGKEILDKAPILCGVGIVENAMDQTYSISALTPQEILSEEPKLLKKAKSLMPRIMFDDLDLLIVDTMGKNFSGDGMDPNITGNFCSPYADGGIRAERRIALDLSEESHGCAVGIGTLDMISKRLYEKIDLEASYPNSITSRMVCQVKIPMILSNDRETIQIALRTCIHAKSGSERIVRIANSMDISHIYISEALRSEAISNPAIRILGEAEEFHFDKSGNLF